MIRPLRFGLFVPQGWILDLIDIPDPVEQFESLVRITKRAEQLGFDSVWLFDHFHTYHQPVLETTFEAWTTTAALARDTNRIRIGQMVTCNSYRNPALLAKMASTVDVMSHGRLEFGMVRDGTSTSIAPMATSSRTRGRGSPCWTRRCR